MNPVRWFRSRRPSHRLERLKPAEAITASAWGLDESQWRSLTDFERAECRRNITAAPRFMP